MNIPIQITTGITEASIQPVKKASVQNITMELNKKRKFVERLHFR